MMGRWFIILFIPFTVRAADDSYLEKMIACDEKEEALVSDAFGTFLTLLSKGELKKEELCFPAHLAKKNNNGSFIIGRAFYITPNELRGFELVVPEECLVEKKGILVSISALVVAHRGGSQGITSLVLKKKTPN